MPIIRTYACEDCNHMMEVTLSMDQVDDPPPPCSSLKQRLHQAGVRLAAALNEVFQPE